ncbi:MAG: T9SS type A sorting domain-containing protein [Calditrichae bacterium]|nr:T9SS type A sorting domain-containing protein [Calditrichia bacterium]
MCAFSNYPNPFNPATTIAFTLPQPATVQLDIFDLNGRLVTTIADGSFGVGRHQSTWDGSAANGETGGIRGVFLPPQRNRSFDRHGSRLYPNPENVVDAVINGRDCSA